MGRPWKIPARNYHACIEELFPKWLKEREGVIVYENHMMDSSHFGERSFMPARYYAKEDEQLHDAPPRIGDVPSRFQEKVDHITLKEFGGDLDKTLACFMEEPSSGHLPVWEKACSYCGARPSGHKPLHRYVCPLCTRQGCPKCMPEGNGNICPKCAGRDD